MGDPFKVELYSVLVSVAVGFVAIFLFVFNLNLYETYVNKYLDAQAKQTSQKSLGTKDKSKSDTKVNNRKLIELVELELQDLSKLFKLAMDLMKQYTLIILFFSVIIGEFLSSIGIIAVTALFEKPFYGGLKTKKTFVSLYDYINENKEENKNWIELKKLLHSQDSSLLMSSSQLNLALAKGFAGLLVMFALLSSINAIMFDFLIRDVRDKSLSIVDILSSDILLDILLSFILMAIPPMLLSSSVLLSISRESKILSLLILISVFLLVLFIICVDPITGIALAIVIPTAIALIYLNYHPFIIILLMNVFLLMSTFVSMTSIVLNKSITLTQLNLVLSIFNASFGLLSLTVSFYHLQRANQMLYIIYEKSRKKWR